MGQTAVTGISNNVRVVAGYARAALTDVPENRFSRFAVGADGPVVSNHPAWVVGHLSLYPGRAAGMLGLEIDVAPPEGWEEIFGPDSECVDDADGTRYPAKGELVDRFMSYQSRISEALMGLDDDALAVETPVERYRSRFPTVMCAVDFLLTAHAMLHLGQVSAWRRIEGLGSAM